MAAIDVAAFELDLDAPAALAAVAERCGFTLTGDSHPFPYGDERFGIPRRPDAAL